MKWSEAITVADAFDDIVRNVHGLEYESPTVLYVQSELECNDGERRWFLAELNGPMYEDADLRLLTGRDGDVVPIEGIDDYEPTFDAVRELYGVDPYSGDWSLQQFRLAMKQDYLTELYEFRDILMADGIDISEAISILERQ